VSGLSFASPFLLLALLAIPVVVAAYVLLERRRARRAEAWATPGLLPNMIGSSPGPRRYIPAALLVIALIALLVGFARPEVRVAKAGEGATIVLAVDTSGSMAATDVTPSRLTAADAAITAFVNAVPSTDRIALVTFSDGAVVPVPPTYAHAQVVAALPRHTVPRGTALGDAIDIAVRVALKSAGTGAERLDPAHPTAAVLLISDGGGNAGRVQPAAAATAARASGVPVSTIAVGTSHGSVSQKLNLSGKTYTKVTQVPVETATLQQVATTSGGAFFAAGSATQLKDVYGRLSGLPSQGKKPLDVTGWAIGGGLVLVACAALLSGLWFRRVI
jgi:Ca-activated chloride channel family protein